MPSFPPDVVSAVLAHMNSDHPDDSLVIVRAFGRPDAESARMTDVDADAGTWSVSVAGHEESVRIPWSQRIAERPQIRTEVVALYRQACERLGIEFPRAEA